MRIVLASAMVLLLYNSACTSNDSEKKILPQDAAQSSLDQSLSPDTHDQKIIVEDPFGRICDATKKCADTAPECVIGIQGSSDKGYCSRTCTDVGQECFGAPNGQQAKCVPFTTPGKNLDGGGKVDAGIKMLCGFFCKAGGLTWDCPVGMTCGKANEQGTALCLP
jgi:hypothetical protein